MTEPLRRDYHKIGGQAEMIIHEYTITSTSASSILLQPWFFALVFSGAIDSLCGIASGVAIERDWVVLLAGINTPIALAQANAVLHRIDLLCEPAGNISHSSGSHSTEHQQYPYKIFCTSGA